MPDLEYTEEAKRSFFLEYKEDLLLKAQGYSLLRAQINQQVAQWYKHHGIIKHQSVDDKIQDSKK